MISTHTSPTGGDSYAATLYYTKALFQPTPPPREATTFWVPISRHDTTFQPTPPPREATRAASAALQGSGISTHTSPTGGDSLEQKVGDYKKISTHTSPTGGDIEEIADVQIMLISTHTSPTGGDENGVKPLNRLRYFNPHLPHGRRQQLFTISPDIFIQNHYFIPLLSAKSFLLLIP